MEVPAAYVRRANPANAYSEVLLTQIQASFTQPEIPAFEPFVGENVVAQFLHLTNRRVLEMARKGELPAHPIGHLRKTWRFRLSEIEAHFSQAADCPRNANIALAVPATQGRKRLG
jgi:hypothetical protein